MVRWGMEYDQGTGRVLKVLGARSGRNGRKADLWRYREVVLVIGKHVRSVGRVTRAASQHHACCHYGANRSSLSNGYGHY